MSAFSQLSRSWPKSAALPTVLTAGAVISGTDASENKIPNSSNLSGVLHARLEKIDTLLDGVARERPIDLASLKLDTAFASLYVLERVHAALYHQHQVETASKADTSDAKGSVGPPLIGSRDMAQLRTHLSVVYNWGTELLLARILPTLPNKRSPRLPPGAQIIDLTASFEDYTLLFGILARLLSILFPDGVQGNISTTFVAMILLNRNFGDLLRPCLCLGWLPNELRGDLPSAVDIRPYMSRLLNSIPPSQTIASLGHVLSKPTNVPTYVAKVCSVLLSGMLLRPAGVAGLLSATFGEDLQATDTPLVKLESVSEVLNHVPSNTPREIYFGMIIPRLLYLLGPDMAERTPPAHKRAAAFSLSRMLVASGDDENANQDVRRCVAAWCLLDSFNPAISTGDDLPANAILENDAVPGIDLRTKARAIARKILVFPPEAAVVTLSTILMNTDPSPELISVLLQPIIPQLYSLLEHLRGNKTADPALREIVEGLLGTWARAAGKDEVVDTLWKVIDGGGYSWVIDDAGALRVTERSETLPSLTLAQLADLQEGKLDNKEDGEANLLNLQPRPLQFAQFLKSIDREDVSSALYLRTLDAHAKVDNESDPMRRGIKMLLFLLIMQIATQVGEAASEESPFKRPDVSRMLMFIKMSLEQDSAMSERESSEKLTLDSLRIVSEEEQEGGDGGDSDDEDLAPGLEGVDKNEHLSVTAVNLLLALLEGEKHWSIGKKETVPLLNEIYSQLEPLANSSSDALRPRAREARLTLTARLASALPSKGIQKTSTGEEDAQEKYQRALKLLQDPLLPVRAHGLLLLRELVAPAKQHSKGKTKKGAQFSADLNNTGAIVSTVQGAQVAAPAIAPALVPAILSIFMQSIQDEDSYIFLNSVQGLAAMVDGFGKEVLRGMVGDYARGLDGVGGSAASMTSREVDKRLRIGEALGQVITRCGSTLGNYADIIVPPVFAIVRAASLPTTLRTSAVSLLATAVDTSALALNAYTSDLTSAMVDLVQVETVAVADARPGGRKDTSDADMPTQARSDAAGSADLKKKSRKYPHDAERSGGKGTNQRTSGEDGNTMDLQPVAANGKFPPLRRAALHFLSLLVRSLLARKYEGDTAPGDDVSGLLIKRGITVLRYVSATDQDEVVQVMAREAAEELEQLGKALIGL
ncbi:hypothetical protein EW145_g4599 [Phellinidium pouzarii]|uniref:RNA polymerase II assembly factor Rtp1 C-terminal domain-containing protein n=1 Tax=Phellinidium pouzarii TaxID=167371 RepID=A0A4S4L3F3_9AGAM|nr:hypothetical protein EW145_g4599 [Phellinidium pouzarii]